MKIKFFIFRRRFVFLTLTALIVLMVFGINAYISANARGRIFRDPAEIPEKKTALVLGARVYENGELSDVLKDRLDSTVDLLFTRKIERIIVSGDNGRTNYDETDAMRDYLIDSKIPPRIIFTDYAGFDTFDSIFRAKEIFGAQELIIVSQEFHLPRALFLADSLDIDAIGLSANLRQYAGATSMQLREIPANIKAFANVIFNSQPKFLGEKIPIEGDGRESWDNNPLEPTETSNP